MKKLLTILAIMLLAVTFIFAGGAKGGTETESSSSFSFTDDLGRTFTFSGPIERIAPSGNLAQMILYSLAKDEMVGLSSYLDESALRFLDEETNDLPLFGTFYGKKANLNREAVILEDPDVVIDMGEIKGSREAMINDLDKLSGDIMIPVIFIEAYLDNTPDVYRTAGKLLGLEDRAEELAAFAEDAIGMAADAREKIDDPITVYYSTSPDGLEAIAEGNFHGEVIEKIGAKNIVPSSFGESGVSISMEQLYIWNPEVILFQEEEAYRHAMESPEWQVLDAVAEGNVYLIPSEPYSFIDAPPATNRIIGIYWLGNLLYPELYPVDVVQKTIEYYSLYYSYDLTEEHAREILHI